MVVIDDMNENIPPEFESINFYFMPLIESEYQVQSSSQTTNMVVIDVMNENIPSEFESITNGDYINDMNVNKAILKVNNIFKDWNEVDVIVNQHARQTALSLVNAAPIDSVSKRHHHDDDYYDNDYNYGRYCKRSALASPDDDDYYRYKDDDYKKCSALTSPGDDNDDDNYYRYWDYDDNYYRDDDDYYRYRDNDYKKRSTVK
ncbi:hypothetical protein C1646_771118 [Rhizophagus diaphanus]|nr:hypothetical protein C1646_771118 [Rhizophagus diaphanus] [Rhizophagus sp. MUCL 43196]